MKNCKQGLLAILAVASMASASATPLFGDTTNNYDNRVTNAPQANSAALGLGVGVGVGIGQGGSVNGSGNSMNVNRNGQEQAQALNSRNTATGGTASATGGTGGGGGSAVSGGNVISVGGDNTYIPRDPVASAYAAPLTATNGTCMGSSSAGGQGTGFGLSFGTTWTDTSCDIRYDAAALQAAGLPGAARARLCQKAEIAKAMEDGGTPCPKSKTGTATAPVATAPAGRAPKPWEAGG